MTRLDDWRNLPDYRLDPPEPPEYPACKCCGSTEYDQIYFDIDGEWAGCDACMSHEDADDYWGAHYEEEEINRKAAMEDYLYDLMRDEQLERQYDAITHNAGTDSAV